jgi:YbbR domain-containing protein
MFESGGRRTRRRHHANNGAGSRKGGEPKISRQRLKDVAAHFVIFIGVAGAWAVTVFDDPAQDVARSVPLEIRGLRENLAFEPLTEKTAVVEMRASRRRLQALSPGSISAYVDLSHASPGRHEFSIAAAVPAGIRVASIVPPVLDVEVLERRSLPVEPRLDDSGLPTSFEVAGVNPARVQVVGRSAFFEGVTAIFTRPVRQPFPSSGRLTIDLEVPDGLRLVDAKQGRVVVTVSQAATATSRHPSPAGR